jgi:2-hydroxychromene-2-carboxylate isomerase
VIEFWCDFASPYTYLAASRIDALAGDLPRRCRPFSLAPIFRASGWQTSPFEIYRDKGRYMWRDVEREAERLAIPFRMPSQFPRNSVPAAKLALAGAERGWCARFGQRVMHASFAEDRDIADAAVLDALLAELGLDPAAVRAEAAAEPFASALRRSTEEAIARHIFGAPTFMIGDEMFWGNDRLEQAIAWARRA